jgi:hypothetical protein
VHLHEEWHGLFAARAGHICGGGHTTGHKPRLIKQALISNHVMIQLRKGQSRKRDRETFKNKS